MSDRPYRFYAAEVSYFSGKARPALRAKRVSFEEIPATPQAYRDVILPRTGAAFIPVVVTPEDETLQDTSDILDWLEVRFPDPPLYPTTPVQRVVAYLLELYADEFLLIPALHYRWSFPESEAKARADFAAVTGVPEFSDTFADRIKGSVGLVGVNGKAIPAIEAHTEELLAAFDAHLAEQRFALGACPSLADCALMGPLYPHLYLDAVPARLLRERALRVCHWIERMNHPDPAAFGAWLPGDALAPTLRPLLELVGSDAVPLLLDTLCAVETWADEHAREGATPPRAVGMHATSLRGVGFERYSSPYALWMAQRPLDAYRALDGDGRAAVDRALGGTGCEGLLAYEPRHRLAKRGVELVFERRS